MIPSLLFLIDVCKAINSSRLMIISISAYTDSKLAVLMMGRRVIRVFLFEVDEVPNSWDTWMFTLSYLMTCFWEFPPLSFIHKFLVVPRIFRCYLTCWPRHIDTWTRCVGSEHRYSVSFRSWKLTVRSLSLYVCYETCAWALCSYVIMVISVPPPNTLFVLFSVEKRVE